MMNDKMVIFNLQFILLSTQQTTQQNISSKLHMAAAVSLSFSVSSDLHHHHHQHRRLPTNHSLFSLRKSHYFHFKSLVSSSSSHSSSSSSTSTSPTAAYSFLEDTFRTGRFLTNEELDKLKTLEKFVHFQELKSGFLWVRVMRPEEEMDATVNLLAESFAESMLLPVGYEKLLRFLVKQYLLERRAVMPHAVTLVGFYREKQVESQSGGEQVELAATVEVCFDKRGANASPPTPTPPKNAPYICNMTVQKQLRRRGIGWHLLKASEEIISQMTSSKDVYLHCRIIDAAPFNMYTKAGYKIVKTDSILILLMLQRRKHLMCKKLPVLDSPLKSDIAGSDEERPP